MVKALSLMSGISANRTTLSSAHLAKSTRSDASVSCWHPVKSTWASSGQLSATARMAASVMCMQFCRSSVWRAWQFLSSLAIRSSVTAWQGMELSLLPVVCL
jgi:hypothetical protein